MRLDKVKILWGLARSKSYVVLTDHKAEIMIPMMNLQKFDSVLLLSAQTAALQEFNGRLGGLIKDHEDALKVLQERDAKHFNKAKTKVSKAKKV